MDQENYPGAFIFTGVEKQVYFIHEGIKVWCDQAIFYEEQNFFRAFGNVKMNQGDTINLTSKYAEYDGMTQFAFASEDVVLTSPSNVLTTDSLFFNRIKQESFYRSGGMVKDSSSTINSIVGRYFMERDKYAFRDDVVVTNPEYKMNTEILDFYPESGHAYLYGPSTIIGETSKVYCERGFYNTTLDEGYFTKNAKIDYDSRNVVGDSIYFRRADNFASATNNIVVTDTLNQSVVKGHYAEVYKDLDSLFITKNPIASTKQDKDSVHIASDVLMITGPEKNRIIRAFKDARIYKTDLSGKADSIWSGEASGLTKMITNPILWAEESQITGDTIHLISNQETEKIDSLKVFYDAFMVMKDSIEGYNQVKGKEMYALFNDENDIEEVNFIKNTETIYYVREDDGTLVGIDKALSATIKLLMKDNDIEDVYYYNAVESDLMPEEEFPPNARKLKNFNWRGDEMIRSKADLFKDRKAFELVPIQGLKAQEIEDAFFDDTNSSENPINNSNSTFQQKNIKGKQEDESANKNEKNSIKPQTKDKPKEKPQLEKIENKKE
ncbi:hypothetical protein GCM10010832_09370 [Psychroflexus planctonicus]|uniref:Organic solvent tolerance-like N-terminal domain-containing protein n=2 Tax=Psychroflexus planctonicus TaxID=1526575 RepID=A0ABQ1SFP9_9FLAO|nr:hypothetical protein GCM10010832_09370 [Psychroflexus planctonicus]